MSGVLTNEPAWSGSHRSGDTTAFLDVRDLKIHFKTDDGVVINVVNTGEICPGENGAPAAVRTLPVFEPPLGKYEWLGRHAFVGTLGMAPPSAGPAVLIRFYQVK